jgi:hypothetical protein
VNGSFTVTAVPNTTEFTYTVGTTFASTETGTGGTATREITLTEGMDLATTPGITCSPMSAYLLSGYVRFDTSSNPTGNEPSNVGANNNTLPLDSTAPLSLDTSNGSGGSPAMTCYAQQQKIVTTSCSVPTNRNNTVGGCYAPISSITRSGSTVTVTAAGHGFAAGDVIAINEVNPSAFSGAFTVGNATANTFTYTLPPPLPAATSGVAVGANPMYAKKVQRLTIPETSNVAGYNTVIGRFVSYACVVTPVDHDSNVSTPQRWWGRVTLNSSGWNIGAGSSDYRVCRYSADYNGVGGAGNVNSEHPSWYRGVTGALDSQNFLITLGEACPTDQPQNLGSPFNPSDDSTVAHQPNSTRSAGEPAQTSTDILMD